MKKKNIWGPFERLRPAQIEAITLSYPIAYLPWGALEYHGMHNPTGLDSIKAYGMATDLAQRVGGIVFPVVHAAANLISSYPLCDFKRHSIEFSEELIRMMCREYLQQLFNQEYKIIVLLTGHAGEPHIDILKEVAQEFNKKYSDKYVWAIAEFDIVPDEVLVANHSAIGETALQLHYAPETVALDLLPQKGEITLEEHAVSGADPRPATAKMGKEILNIFLENATKELKILIPKYITNQ